MDSQGSGVGSGYVVVAGGLYLWAFGLGIIVPNQPLEISSPSIMPLNDSGIAADKDGTTPMGPAVQSIPRLCAESQALLATLIIDTWMLTFPLYR